MNAHRFSGTTRVRGRRGLLIAALALLTTTFTTGLVSVPAPPAHASGQTACTSSRGTEISHVVWVVFENRSVGEVQGHAPYLDTLAADCGFAANYHNITHPSLPNYIAMTSGRPLVDLPTTDCPVFCPQNVPSLFAQDVHWNVFAESAPSNCARVDAHPYVVHHTAAPYYPLVNCQTNDLPLSAMNTASLSRFTLVIPDITHDMHPGTSSVAAGDAWLARFLPNILNRPQYQAGTVAVFITWDEGGLPRQTSNCGSNITDTGCHVGLYVVSKSITPGTVSTELFNHYCLLRTTEELLGYPLLDVAATGNSLLAAFPLS